MKISLPAFAVLALVALPSLAQEPAAPEGASATPAVRELSGDAGDPAGVPAVRIPMPSIEGLAPSTLVLEGLKEFIRSGRAYEQCGVRDMEAAVNRNMDTLLVELQQAAVAEDTGGAELLKLLAERSRQSQEVPAEVFTAFGSLHAFYAAVTETLKQAAGQWIGSYYRGSAAEQGVVWSNEQVADACVFIAGYLTDNTH